MMWEYVRLEDDTQVSYSEVREDNTVKVVVERPRDWGFDTAECILPAFNWVSREGFSEADLKELDDFVRNNAPLILRFAYEGGRVYAQSVSTRAVHHLLLDGGERRTCPCSRCGQAPHCRGNQDMAYPLRRMQAGP